MRIIRVDSRRADLTAPYYGHFIRLKCGTIKRVNLKNTDLLMNMLSPINFIYHPASCISIKRSFNNNWIQQETVLCSKGQVDNQINFQTFVYGKHKWTGLGCLNSFVFKSLLLYYFNLKVLNMRTTVILVPKAVIVVRAMWSSPSQAAMRVRRRWLSSTCWSTRPLPTIRCTTDRWPLKANPST